MEIDGTKLMKRIVNKQFEIIGEKITFADIPADGIVEVGKKKKNWWEVYHFTEEQENEWKKWVEKEIEGNYLEDTQLLYIEMRYGFTRDYSKKEGS